MAKAAFTGRPVYKLTPEIITQVEQLAYKGLNQRQIGDCLGISEDTFIKQKKVSADFSNALDGGRRRWQLEEADRIELVRNALFKNATTPAYGEKGSVGPPGGSVEAQKFFLKARANWIDTRVEVSGDPDRPIMIAPLFAVSYKKELETFLDGKTVDAP